MNESKSKKEDIYFAAAKIFAEKGYGETSLDEIALTAKVAKGTIFYHFSGKEELYSLLIEKGVTLLTEKINAITSQNISAKEKLDEVIDFHFLFFKDNKNLCLMILSQLGNFKKHWRKSITLIQINYIPSLNELILQCKKENIINKNLNSGSIIITMFSLLAVSGIDWAIFHPQISSTEITKLTKLMIIGGLK